MVFAHKKKILRVYIQSFLEPVPGVQNLNLPILGVLVVIEIYSLYFSPPAAGMSYVRLSLKSGIS